MWVLTKEDVVRISFYNIPFWKNIIVFPTFHKSNHIGSKYK